VKAIFSSLHQQRKSAHCGHCMDLGQGVFVSIAQIKQLYDVIVSVFCYCSMKTDMAFDKESK